MKAAPAITFAREGSALDGFDDRPLGGDGGRAWRRLWLAAAVALGALFTWYVGVEPTCASPASVRVVGMHESEAMAVVTETAEAGSGESMEVCSSADRGDSWRLRDIGSVVSNVLRP